MSRSTSWNPDRYARSARFVSDLALPLLEHLKPRPGEVMLDLGCGDGALSEKLASTGCALYAVDASFAQIKAARKRGLEALVMDGHQLAFKPVFDAVFTNAALHWMKQPEKVAAAIRDVLRPGGRFIGEFGGKGNVEAIRSALHTALRRRAIDPESVDPWYYPAAEEHSALLGRCGFAVDYMELIPRPTELPEDILTWLEIFAQPFTSAVPPAEREKFLLEVRGALAPKLRDERGIWIADYVRLRFHATRQERDYGPPITGHE